MHIYQPTFDCTVFTVLFSVCVWAISLLLNRGIHSSIDLPIVPGYVFVIKQVMVCFSTHPLPWVEISLGTLVVKRSRQEKVALKLRLLKSPSLKAKWNLGSAVQV